MNPWMSRLRHTYNANDVKFRLALQRILLSILSPAAERLGPWPERVHKSFMCHAGGIGATAAIRRMLVQSQPDRSELWALRLHRPVPRHVDEESRIGFQIACRGPKGNPVKGPHRQAPHCFAAHRRLPNRLTVGGTAKQQSGTLPMPMGMPQSSLHDT